eukprot:TRINITY_DN213_c0_g1_i9.p1 TRINITY_DN213_c0_g1~~TRINITY_DN213_c0_g1_i9.p1  ORF type:complete len:1464 (-),score=535.99 TRINITY_DN213_c0_g1_i9:6-4307(-)
MVRVPWSAMCSVAAVLAAMLAAVCMPGAAAAVASNTLIWHAWTSPIHPASAFTSLIARFEAAHPGVHVALRVMDFNANPDLADDAAGHLPPDLISFAASRTAREFIHDGVMASLNASAVRFGLAAELPKAFAGPLTAKDGTLGALPVASTQVTFLYRKSMLAKVGIMEPPATWDALVDAARRCTIYAGSDRNWAAAVLSALDKDPSVAAWWADLLVARSAGSEAHQRLINGNTSYTTDDTMRKSLARITDLALQASMMDAGSFFANMGAFLGGAAPFFFGTSIVVSAAPGPLQADIGVLKFPEVTPGVARGELSLFVSFGIPARAERQDLAKAFIDELVMDPKFPESQFHPALGPLGVPILSRHRPSIEPYPLVKDLYTDLVTADSILESFRYAPQAVIDVVGEAVAASINFTAAGVASGSSGASAGGPPSGAAGDDSSGGPPTGPPAGVTSGGDGGAPASADTSSTGGRPTTLSFAGDSDAGVKDGDTTLLHDAHHPYAHLNADTVKKNSGWALTAGWTGDQADDLQRLQAVIELIEAGEVDRARAMVGVPPEPVVHSSLHQRRASDDASGGRLHMAQAPSAETVAAMRQAASEAVEAALVRAEVVRYRIYLGRIPTPVADPPAGAYESPLTVTLAVPGDPAATSDPDSATAIYYTLDGTVPTSLSPKYTTPLTVAETGSLTVRFVAISEGLSDSARVAVLYTVTGDGGGFTVTEYLLYFALPGAVVLLLLALAFYMMHRRVKASKQSWRVDPADIVVHRDRVLGVGSFGIVYEGEFRGSTVAVKEIFMDRVEYKAALAAAQELHGGDVSSLFSTKLGTGGVFGTATAARVSASKITGANGAGSSAGGVRSSSYRPTPAGSTKSGIETIEESMLLPGTSTRDVAKTAGSEVSLERSLAGTGLGGTQASRHGMLGSTDAGTGGTSRPSAARERAARRHALESEIEIVAKMRHPNALFLFGCHLTRARATLVMEKMDSSVYDILQARTVKLSARRRLEMALDAASGIAYLHSHTPSPVLHRDLKTPNLLVTDRGVVKVADFGLSEVGAARGSSIGSAPWTAPEVFADPKQYAAHSDVYSFGVVLWELATSGEPWVAAASIAEIRRAVCGGERPALGGATPLAENVPAGLGDLIRECWAQDPARRPDMGNVKARLATLLAATPDEEDGGADLSLLSLMLPGERARDMIATAKRGEPQPPHNIGTAFIGFADIVGFTTISSELDAQSVSGLLTRCFARFGEILEARGLVLVDTIGDAIFFAGGLSAADQAALAEGDGDDGGNNKAARAKSKARAAAIAEAMALASLEMLEVSTGILIDPSREERGHVRWRFGLASGAVSAALIGSKTLQVQVVGNAVNVASRMESSGEPMRVQCTDEFRVMLLRAGRELATKKRGVMQIKGKGDMTTYWVERAGEPSGQSGRPARAPPSLMERMDE